MDPPPTSPGTEAARQIAPQLPGLPIERPARRPVADRTAPRAVLPVFERPEVRGKFIFVGDEKLYVRGATYGAFRPDEHGNEFHDLDLIDRDFAMMAANGMNAVRIPHTMPPRSLLDVAQKNGLRVMVGLSAEQYVGYLIDKKEAPDIEELVRARVRTCAGHPALLCYAIGNEIPAPIVRWLGRRPVEQYLERLCRVIRAEDPGGLVTYVNYPTTEYLQLPFLDLLSVNVYLEARDRLEAYLARLQTVAGDRPLIMSEVGLDSLRNGEEKQAEVLDWQVRTTFAAGCAGAFVFAWTDDWYRGDVALDEWAFGLTTKERLPKPALASTRRAFEESPFAPEVEWPRVSVVVCTLNGSRTLDECLAGLERLDYPDYEVIVVDDGSTDATARIAGRYRCQLISTENHGLSAARNTGLEAATGSIVAYLDDDAYPDVHWLRYLALTFVGSDYAGVGGPNLTAEGDGWVADCVADAPGNPVHVLITDRDAEHIPGCNMAFRKAALDAVGGFDPQFRVAGDDVDLCWRLSDAGLKLGFCPAATVWHHRRSSLRAFWRQQRGYGRAEGMLGRKWPARYDDVGHVAWAGRIYGVGPVRALTRGGSRVYHGVWGAAPFQSLYEPAVSGWGALLHSPLWYLLTAGLGAMALLGLDWGPMRLAAVPFAAAAGVTVVQASRGAARARSGTDDHRLGWWDGLRRRAVTTLLHLTQPVARLQGRLAYALRDPLPGRGVRFRRLFPLTSATWTEHWREPAERLRLIESALQDAGGSVRRGGEFDRWDLDVQCGSFGSARLRVAVEDHARGCQLIRTRTWPRVTVGGPALTLVLGALAVGATGAQAWVAAGVLALAVAYFGLRSLTDPLAALSVTRGGLERVGLAPRSPASEPGSLEEATHYA